MFFYLFILYLKELTLTELFEIDVPELISGNNSYNKESTATATTSQKYICPISVETWTDFETDVLNFFTTLQCAEKYQTLAGTFQLPDLAINADIPENRIQFYFECNVIQKINKVLKQEEKKIYCTTNINHRGK